MIYKLQVWLWDEDIDKGEWRDCYLDVSKVLGFFIPDPKEAGKAINIYFDGGVFTIKQEKHILDYLLENFVNKSIKNKN